MFQNTEVIAIAIPRLPVTSMGMLKIKLNAMAMMTNRMIS
jgi:hypothetical protein